MSWNCICTFVCLFLGGVSWAETPNGMIKIPENTYTPFVLKSDSKKGEPERFRKTLVTVPEFFIDSDLVTNEEFRQFVSSNPDWQRSNIKKIFADSHYLQHWKSDVLLTSAKDKRGPVTNISWFAAKAYCESKGKDLPTTDQWEVAFFDQGKNQDKVKEKVLAWYGRPSGSSTAEIRTGGKNEFGLYDLSTVVWEWTLDFNSFLAGDELRASGNERNGTGLFCGGGSLGMLDSSDYIAFMRYSFRASLKASYTTGNLGFRCAKEMK